MKVRHAVWEWEMDIADKESTIRALAFKLEAQSNEIIEYLDLRAKSENKEKYAVDLCRIGEEVAMISSKLEDAAYELKQMANECETEKQHRDDPCPSGITRGQSL